MPAFALHRGPRTKLASAMAAAAIVAAAVPGLILATASAANAESGCKSGSVISGPAHGWYLQICETPRVGSTDTFSWAANNTDSGAAVADVSYAIQCAGGTTGSAVVLPSVPAFWNGSYSAQCAFSAELTAGGAPGPGGAPIVLTLSAG